MKNILIVVPDLYYGGAEKQFRYLINGLSCNDNIKLVVCIEHAYGSKLEKESEQFIKEHNNVKFIKCEGLSITSGEIKKLLSAFRLIPIIKNIIQKHNIEVVLGFGSLYSAIIKSIRRKDCRIILGERCDGHYNNALTRYNTKFADMIICNSRLAKEYMESVGYRNVHLIKNGVVVEESHPKMLEHEEFRILVPARIDHHKNQLQIIKAVSHIKDFAFKVFLCGEIQEKTYYEECKKCIDENNLQNQVEIMGVVSNMKDYYQSADLVILSSYCEGTPNVLLESFAYKRLCIASNIEANKDVIRDDRFLFELDDDKDLYDKIQEIRSLSDEEKEQIIEHNYQFVKDNYSIDRMVNNYIELLEIPMK